MLNFMTVKQTVRQGIEASPDNTPELLALHKRARANMELMEAMQSVEHGDVLTADEIRMCFGLRCQAERVA